MTITVYATNPAARFHHTRECPRRTSAQILSDLDCGCDTYCTHKMPRTHPVLRMELDRALRSGKRPCTYCYRDPDLLHTVMPSSRETFGHEPVSLMHTGFGVTGEICMRCHILTTTKLPNGQRALSYQDVPWPCTSAIVLGLVPRPAP